VGTALADRGLGHLLTADVHQPVPGPGAASTGVPPSPQASGSRARVIDGARRCVGRFGVSKTTVDDIAREAGLSRATVYRAFPGGRDEVLSALVRFEVDEFFVRLGEHLDRAENLEDLLTAVLSVSGELLAANPALRFVLEYEPEAVLPFVSFHAFDRVLAVAGDRLLPYLRAELGETEARRVAEWVVRLLFSYLACPAGVVEDGARRAASGAPPLVPAKIALHPAPIGEERARRLVRQFVLPGIRVRSAAERSSCTEPTTD